jgi:hypothetical protein
MGQKKGGICMSMVLIYPIGIVVCLIFVMAYRLNELFEEAGRDYEKVDDSDKTIAVLSSLTLSLIWPLTLFITAMVFISYYGGKGAMLLFVKIRGGGNGKG